MNIGVEILLEKKAVFKKQVEDCNTELNILRDQIDKEKDSYEKTISSIKNNIDIQIAKKDKLNSDITTINEDIAKINA